MGNINHSILKKAIIDYYSPVLTLEHRATKTAIKIKCKASFILQFKKSSHV